MLKKTGLGNTKSLTRAKTSHELLSLGCVVLLNYFEVQSRDRLIESNLPITAIE